MKKKPILVIDDEPDLISLVSYNLSQEGFEVTSAKDGPSGLAIAREQQPRLIILDLMLPGMDGLQVCRRIREDPRTRSIPIIMLTAKGAETDRVVGLELGADDYVVKPFSPRELVARVRAVLRRGETHSDFKRPIQCGSLRINRDMHQAFYNDVRLPLTATEFDMLLFLAAHPNHVFSREEMIERALGKDVVVTDRNIDVHVGAIRRKLGPGKRHIETVRGVGYRFIPVLPSDQADHAE